MREAVVLKLCQGWTLPEIAARISRSVPSVASLLRRGLKDLRKQLVELRVLGPAEASPVSVYDESDGMLDQRVELPAPTPLFSVMGELGPTPLPDAPEIPDDEPSA
jgi:hypothetical protein